MGKKAGIEDEESLYRAMVSRDYRFDGKFFVGVRTTGVYCRPICPARPQRRNVEFFPSVHAAEKAGYRPCLRCRPEAAPLSPAWIGKSAIVQRALKRLHDTQTLELDENGFAEGFGVSSRHLRRLFREEIGKTPRQIAFENRLNLARKLISETALPLASAGLAAGFASVRRFNAAFRERFRKAPSEIRRARLPQDAPMVLTLAYRPPFDFAGLLAFYARHRVEGLETFPAEGMTRIISMAGKTGRISITDDPLRNRLRVAYAFPDTAAIGHILNRIRRMFDLDSDPLLVANAMAGDRALAALHRQRPGIRIPTGWDAFETAIATILGQLVSVERGRRLTADLIRLHGEIVEAPPGSGPIRAFPAAEALARADLSRLGTTGKRKESIKAFAAEVASGRLSLDPAQNVEAFAAQVMRIPGIGRWTADYMALRVLGHADAFPETDLVLARALAAHPRETLSRISPWRGYAAMLLWGEYARAAEKSAGEKP